MSNSRKKNPFIGWTVAKSEKFDKVMAHKKLRQIHKNLLKYADIENGEDISLPTIDEVSNPYNWAKDGKMYVPPTHPNYQKAIRK